jgi:putative transposase
LRIALNRYIYEYNTYRPHSSIGGQCPSLVYDGMQANKVAPKFFEHGKEDNLLKFFRVLTMGALYFQYYFAFE